LFHLARCSKKPRPPTIRGEAATMNEESNRKENETHPPRITHRAYLKILFYTIGCKFILELTLLF
jgi:hypothetical protein